MTGYHAVLTGASGGIGAEIADALASRCENLILAGRDEGRLGTLADRLSRRHDTLRVSTVAGDLTDESTLQRIEHAARAMAKPPDLLIHNAGVNEFHEFETQDEATILRMLNVNLYAPIAVSHRLLPLLKAATRAQIVNVGSMLGYIGYPGYAAYCASKFGLRGFSEALRRELSDSSVMVRYFAPRTTATPLNSPAVSAMHRDLRTAQDTPRLVAERLLRFIGTTAGECRIGFPEKLYAFLNRLIPAITDRAIAGQLAVIRRHLPATRPSAEQGRLDIHHRKPAER